MSRFTRILLAAFIVQATACATLGIGHYGAPESTTEWPVTLDVARSRAQDGRFESADTVLADFALRYAGTPEALETAYWRAVLKADPSNPHASLPTAIASLEAYLRDTRPRA
ncbi:MAG TPA: hypothetical protein VIP11_24880, partial [Gemmatimonadaceae bacterium]